MSEAIKISTSKYIKEGKVNIDGKIWSVKLPGAGTEMKLSQAIRSVKVYTARLESLSKKIDAGEATEADLDSYEDYDKRFSETEKLMIEFFTNVFRDSTPDNSEVKEWIENTPTSIIEQAFNEIREQADLKQAEVDNGQKQPTGSTQ